MFTISGCCHTHSNDLCVLHLYMLPQSWANNQLSRDLYNAFAILSWCESACTALSFNKKKLIFQLSFFFSLCACRNFISVSDWEVCRASPPHSGSAVPLYNFHRGGKESEWRGHNSRLQVCSCFVWHRERPLGRPAVWTVTAGTQRWHVEFTCVLMAKLQ